MLGKVITILLRTCLMRKLSILHVKVTNQLLSS